MAEAIWADRDYLRDVQYKTDANLEARRSIYAYQRPKIDLPSAVLDIAGPSPGDVVADVGCGNGGYLAELARRGLPAPGPGSGSVGRVIGADLSMGMLAAARGRGIGTAALVNADATALPLRSASADVTLAMHMLYHVPSPADAVRELRRITRPGGRVIVALNGPGHMRELRAAIDAAGGRRLPDERLPGERLPGRERIGLDDGAELLRTVFGSVTRHDFEGQLLAPPAAVAAYVRSAPRAADLEALVSSVLSLLFPNDSAPSPITTHSGILVCA